MLIIPVYVVFCQQNHKNDKHQKTIITTTQMLEDAVRHLIGDVDKKEQKEGIQYTKIDSILCQKSLMGMGIDPHNYKAKLSDRTKIKEADLVITNGLHLEAQMAEAFKLLKKEECVWEAGDQSLDAEDKIKDEFTDDCDPHIWFGIDLWKKVVSKLKDKLDSMIFFQKEKEYLNQNHKSFEKTLDELQKHIKKELKALKEKKNEGEKLIIVTAHDAFSYWEKSFSKDTNCSFELKSIQGISTQTEANIKTIIELADELVQNNVKAIFTESSMPKDSLESLRDQVNQFRRAKNLDPIKIPEDGELYSDSLGSENKKESFEGCEFKHSTYVGAFLNNMKVIKENLL
ncbi:zinc ABC transporter substrate-binding protein [Candidatus Phytoplasma phoenicium]|uniref:Zinc ABC transporter substrate-binding protein n=1 Tax=Candidatus Phytoplasma phoenicium TaxID=198422 RepID=A0A2S8NTF0_9MOLU|nr:zinc ABC transporter substrate-binding protein [Candidatus Phytoplasma phoenicium]